MQKYEKKMVAQGLAAAGEPLMAEVNAEIVWNRYDPRSRVLSEVLSELSVNSLCFSQPAPPYRTVVDHLSAESDVIHLKDNETRLFLHDIPVVRNFSAARIGAVLKRRKAAVVAGHGIVTCGTVTIEQCFVTYSSVLFACFVKFFADFLDHASKGVVSEPERRAFESAVADLTPVGRPEPTLKKAPFSSEDQVYRAISEVGRPIVNHGFVDSAMGNISYRYRKTLYISQTGSFLDELDGCIDPCPLDNSACTGITASSELPAHMRIVTESSHRAVLHGHPKFAVIMSLVCDRPACRFAGRCHTECPETRRILDIPIVPGESGTGPNALCKTVPRALKTSQGVIVYGHGVFTAGREDFNAPFKDLAGIETICREAYFARLKDLGFSAPTCGPSVEKA